MIRFYSIAVCLYLTVIKVEGSSENEGRVKRQINGIPLVYPYGATYKLIIGFASPIANDDKIPLVFGVNFQYQYLHVQNISDVSRYYFIKEVSREQRDADLMNRKDERLVFYRSVADMLDMKGMNGYECVLRAICEAAQYPVEEEALIGEVLHILLTPDYGRTAFEDTDPDWEVSMVEYIDAATAGRQMFNCAAIYNVCPEGQGILEFMTLLRDEYKI